MEEIEAEIYLVLQSVCGATLGLEVERPTGDAVHPDLEQAVGAFVEISGETPTSLLLECSEALARATASAMFSSDPSDLTDLDLQDAVAELINIIGGNVRALVSSGSQLGIPKPFREHCSQVGHNKPVHEFTLSCGGMPFRFSATVIGNE